MWTMSDYRVMLLTTSHTYRAPAFLAAADPSFADTATRTVLLVIAWGAGIPGLVFALIAAAGYLPEGLRALREGRGAHSAEPPPT